MIKFTDVCKAYIRYWYVILICIVLAFLAVIVAVPKAKVYDVSSTFSVGKAGGNTENVIRETIALVESNAFLNVVIDDIKTDNEELADRLTAEGLKANIKVAHTKGESTLVITYSDKNEHDAKTISESINDVAGVKFAEKIAPVTPSVLTKLSQGGAVLRPSKVGIYSVIGILIGLVLGVVVVTFFVVFNPFVENKELLSKETELDVLSHVTKKDDGTSIASFATNLDLILADDKEKFVSFTTDSMKYDVSEFVGKIATIFAATKKVLVVSYNDVANKVSDVDYKVITRDSESVKALANDYDVVLAICPNMITSKYYLNMSDYAKDMVIVAKKWLSKTDNVKKINSLASDKDMNVLGLVYQD